MQFNVQQLKNLEDIKYSLEIINKKLPLVLGENSEYLTDTNKGIVKFKKNENEYSIIYGSSNLINALNIREEDIIGLDILSLHPNKEQIRREIETLEDEIIVHKTYSITFLGKQLKFRSKIIKNGNLFTEFIEIL